MRTATITLPRHTALDPVTAALKVDHKGSTWTEPLDYDLVRELRLPGGRRVEGPPSAIDALRFVLADFRRRLG